MSRNKRIIVGIVGIFIILLALLGITYAYYLTRIEGNTNTNSVSITTADLKLEYDDGTTEILVSEVMMPGETIGKKDFTVTNKGNVLIEDYAVYLEEVTNTLTQKEDMVFTMTCSSSDGSYCEGFVGEYPSENTIIALNSIGVGVTHSYEIEVFYNDTGEDQSVDMGSTLTGKVQIYNQIDVVDIEGTVTGASDGDYVQINSIPKTSKIVDGKYKITAVEPGEHTLKVINKSSGTEVVKGSTALSVKKGSSPSIDGNVITIDNNSQKVRVDISAISSPLEITLGTSVSQFNPYEEGTLAYSIYDNSKLNKNGTSLVSVTPTNIASEISSSDEKVLSKTGDSYGTTYFYRGNVEDNYVNFANMCWRIIRIEGDGSVKIILEDRFAKCDDNETEVTPEVYTGNWNLGPFPYGVGADYKVNYEGLDTTYGANNGMLFSYDAFLNGGRLTATDENGVQTTFSYTALASSDKNLLKNTNICIGDVETGYGEDLNLLTPEQYANNIANSLIIYYEPYVRLSGLLNNNFSSTLVCPSNGWSVNKYRIYPISADEVIHAGGKADTNNPSYYLINNYHKDVETNGYHNFWTLTPSGYIINEYGLDTVYMVDYDGATVNFFPHIYNYELEDGVFADISSRPAASLLNGIKISGGDGTQSNPYVVSGL